MVAGVDPLGEALWSRDCRDEVFTPDYRLLWQVIVGFNLKRCSLLIQVIR